MEQLFDLTLCVCNTSADSRSKVFAPAAACSCGSGDRSDKEEQVILWTCRGSKLMWNTSRLELGSTSRPSLVSFSILPLSLSLSLHSPAFLQPPTRHINPQSSHQPSSRLAVRVGWSKCSTWVQLHLRLFRPHLAAKAGLVCWDRSHPHWPGKSLYSS